MARTVFSILLCLLCSLLAFAGCGESRDPSLPPLVPVTGTIRLDGKPVPKATVMFIPTGDTAGTISLDVTDEEGEYELSTLHDGVGAPVGIYKVTIGKFVQPDGTEFPPGSDIDVMSTPHKSVFPPEYSDPSTSNLTATVPEGGNAIDFDIKSKK